MWVSISIRIYRISADMINHRSIVDTLVDLKRIHFVYADDELDDTLFAMAGLGLVDLVDENLFSANSITQHMVNTPSAKHGAFHLSVRLFPSVPFSAEALDSC
jgi:hypothetical protein